jgi:hypothetical protein
MKILDVQPADYPAIMSVLNDGGGRKMGDMLRIFETVRKKEHKVVRCVTAPNNQNLIDFHRHMGLEIESRGHK